MLLASRFAFYNRCGEYTAQSYDSHINRKIQLVKIEISLNLTFSIHFQPSFDLYLLSLRFFLTLNSLLVHSCVYCLWSSSLTFYFSALRQGALSTDTKNLHEDRSLDVFAFFSHLLQARRCNVLCVCG